MPTSAQLQQIWLLSDTVLYPEAVAFIQAFEKSEKKLLPASQMAGLLNIAEALQYDELRHFVTNQRLRSWPRGKEYIGVFYKELEEQLKGLYTRLVQDTFHLLSDASGRRRLVTSQDAEQLMARLAREYIQHLVAENNDQAARASARPH